MNPTNQEQKVSKTQDKHPTALRVKETVRKKIDEILSKINDKTYGKKIFPSTLIEYLLKFVDENVIHELQEKSLRHWEKVDRQYTQYVRKYGHISREEFDKKQFELFKEWTENNSDYFSTQLSY